ncbi:MAG: carboxypeptidase regulatory-like domain-containing protein [Isosphaeraceae bacterium]
MTKTWIRKPASLGLGLAATMMAAVFGCGGQGNESSDAVVVPDSTAKVTTAPASKPGAAPAAGTSTPSAESTSSTPVKAEGFGTLKGQITFDGAAPEVKHLFEKGKAPKDPTVCAKDGPLLDEKLIVDGATKGVKNVLVYIPKPTQTSPDAKKAYSAKPVLFDQEKCVFIPHVIGVMAGSTITLKSSDPVNHNINARLKVRSFNQLLQPQGKSEFTPEGPERTPAEVTCDIHPWMKAWWMVLDNPYIAVTDDKGYFEIKNAPAGTQKVVVWQEAVDKNGFVTAPSGEAIVLKANDTVVKDFKIPPSRLRVE